MKEKILNGCMLLTVAAALALSLVRGAPQENPGESALPLPLSAAAPTQAPSPAEAYRQRRAETRREERLALQALLDSERAGTEIQEMAQRQLLDLARADETELAVEAALAARAGEEGVCAVRQGTVTVFLTREIDASAAALLTDFIREASGIAPENIRIAALY